jgi:hypothetical protein
MRALGGLILAALLLAAPVRAAETAPKATIADAAWLVGSWQGEGMGGITQEGWSAPADGRMIGHFSLIRGGKAVFYELMLIEEHEGGLRFRVKHFDPDFTGWEEKDRSLDFVFLGAEPGVLHFRSMTLTREGPDGLAIAMRFRNGDTVSEEVLRYRRVRVGR